MSEPSQLPQVTPLSANNCALLSMFWGTQDSGKGNRDVLQVHEHTRAHSPTHTVIIHLSSMHIPPTCTISHTHTQSPFSKPHPWGTAYGVCGVLAS